MSTGEGPSGPRRDPEAEDEQTFADVMNAFSFGTGRRKRKTSGTPGTPHDMAYGESDAASPPPASESYGPASPVDHQPATWEAGHVGPGSPASFVRAYAWTGGRTRSHHHFEVETLVTAADPSGVPGAASQWDRAVLDLCWEPMSVAEVAALVAVPLGVAKVLLGDLADRGMIIVHEAATDAGDAPTQALMQRVLIGLRQL
ncbi:DUF742 domain-containing protein [Streptomyces turgidiscabies]|uniref:DUF742 domain-containing protein n=1 Tax=Streptomyces turgidiscabies TaxID=85558 RepID=A0ABU0RJ35_9ACTN|nr:DUF742 domain-containing protein [Streptomyces turgidiscabies]MDQ0931142.1 hypothetical protein [Streptomyces turgidiscabies]